MLPVLEFDDIESFAVYLGKNEISQQNNPNANARLFIVKDNRVVAKVFDGTRRGSASRKGITFLPGAEKNIENLIRISELLSGDRFPQLALPTALISFEGQIVGYEMPYISGVDLGVALTDKRYSHKQRIAWFNQLAELIIALPDGIFVGDLHAKNVIVRDDNTVTLIDVDGFSLSSGNALTCPAMYMEDLPPKYFDTNGAFMISKDTDILCIFRLFFHYLFEGHDIASFSVEWKKRLPEYLLKRGIEMEFADAVSRLFCQNSNRLHKELFSCWVELPPEGEYRQFLKLTGLDAVESVLKDSINALIKKNCGNRYT